MKPHDSDRDLVLECQAARAGEAEAPFRKLYERHKDRVYNTCYRITGNHADALDASQEAFLNAYRRIAGFRLDARFNSWLHRIAVYACSDLVRRAAGRRAIGGEPLLAERPVLDERLQRPEVAANESDVGKLVQRVVDSLPSGMRETVVLRYFEHLSYDEIAEVLDVSTGTVKSRLHRAHALLSIVLSPALTEFEDE